MWQEKLNLLAKDKLSIRVIARELGVDFKTIKRCLSEYVEISKEASEVNQEPYGKV